MKTQMLRQLLITLAIVAGVTWGAWLLRGLLTLANFTMIYLLAVLVIAIRQGTFPALVGAFVSFLCINFFLVQPYYTFVVADPRELLDLVVFFIIAALAGQLGANVRQRAEDARQRAYEREILFRLTRSFNQLTTVEGVYEALVQVMRADMRARHAHVLPYAATSIASDQTIYYVLLQADDRVYATLRAAFDKPLTTQQVRLMNACASQAAAALQRIDLAEQARKSQQYEEADRLKTAILRAVSHDLRTPITVIKTSAGNLRALEENLSSADRRELYETIEDEADHLNELVGNLLDLSRLRAGAVTLNAALNSLEEVAGDVAARVWQLTGKERLKMVFPDDMPLVNFDHGLMLQAVTNLVDNALRYEPPESQVELRGEAQNGEARLKVINHGENIAPDERAHLMEPFYHGKNGHVGLGLPIANGIVEAHRGRLWVEDTPGGGATFIIALPIEEERQQDEPENTGG